MDFIPYKINEYLENVFYQVPKELFTNPYYKDLKPYSILLYSLLLDRLSLSMKNEWIDENGDIFLIFTRKEAEEKLNLSDKTVTKAFNQLTNVKLINEKRQGCKKTNIIYVGKINHVPTKDIMTRKKAESVKALPVTESVWRKVYDSRNGKFTNQESENLRCNYNKYNKNNYSKCKTKRNSFCNYEQRQYDNLDFLYANNFNQVYEN